MKQINNRIYNDKNKHKKAEHNRRRNSPSKMAIHQVAKKLSSMNVTQLQEWCEAHEGVPDDCHEPYVVDYFVDKHAVKDARYQVC